MLRLLTLDPRFRGDDGGKEGTQGDFFTRSRAGMTKEEDHRCLHALAGIQGHALQPCARGAWIPEGEAA
jgi:hypothetical protein